MYRRRGKYSLSHYSPIFKRIIVLVYTHEVISTKSELYTRISFSLLTLFSHPSSHLLLRNEAVVNYELK